MKVVFDTNVLLSAIFTPGVCEVLLDLCLTSNDVTVVTSPYILDEFLSHAADKLHAPAQKVESAVSQLRQRCVLVEPAAVPAQAFDDPDDLPVLGTAVAGHADVLVTGDQQLLGLGAYQGVAILSPRVFFDRLRK